MFLSTFSTCMNDLWFHSVCSWSLEYWGEGAIVVEVMLDLSCAVCREDGCELKPLKAYVIFTDSKYDRGGMLGAAFWCLPLLPWFLPTPKELIGYPAHLQVFTCQLMERNSCPKHTGEMRWWLVSGSCVFVSNAFSSQTSQSSLCLALISISEQGTLQMVLLSIYNYSIVLS